MRSDDMILKFLQHDKQCTSTLLEYLKLMISNQKRTLYYELMIKLA